MTSKAASLRDWLASDRPTSRRQAFMGRVYHGCRDFSRNRLAMLQHERYIPSPHL